MDHPDDLLYLAKKLSTMHRIYAQHITHMISPYGLGLVDLAIILGLHRAPGVSLNTFSQKKRINKAILSKGIKKLRSQDYIDLEKDPQHKQKYKLYLTDKAKDLVPILRGFVTNYEEKALQSLSKSEQHTFIALLDKVHKQEVD